MYGINFDRAMKHQLLRESRTLNILMKDKWLTTDKVSGRLFKDDADSRLVEIRKVRVERDLRSLESRGKAESMETPGGTILWRRAR